MNEKFRYGNYNRYYGKRLPDKEEDPRFTYFQQKWFENKDVLDVGCNIGLVTIYLAKEFNPRRIVGLDIDGKLIGVARKNIRRYLDVNRNDEKKYPTVFSIQYGPVSAPPAQCSCGSSKFPENIVFTTGNFVPASDDLLDSTKAEYDTVVALSVTKWIHLNWGDNGLKRFFKRAFQCLKPGGVLLLEPQPFHSYKKKKKLTTDIFENYQKIIFKPDEFVTYLLSSEVGFSSSEVIGAPQHKSKGFRRPIFLFTKPTVESISVIESQIVQEKTLNNCQENV